MSSPQCPRAESPGGFYLHVESKSKELRIERKEGKAMKGRAIEVTTEGKSENSGQ